MEFSDHEDVFWSQIDVKRIQKRLLVISHMFVSVLHLLLAVLFFSVMYCSFYIVMGKSAF